MSSEKGNTQIKINKYKVFRKTKLNTRASMCYYHQNATLDSILYVKPLELCFESFKKQLNLRI